MAGLPRAAWYEVRRAQNRKPATYTCPLCGGYLPAMSAHALVSPEGDTSRRRHAHMRCVVAARDAGRLPTRDDARRAAKGKGRGKDAGPARRRRWLFWGPRD